MAIHKYTDPPKAVPVFHEVSQAVAALTAGRVQQAQVTTPRGVLGTWALVDGTPKAVGDVDFTALPTAEWGSVDAADDVAGTVTLAAGHSFVAGSGILRIWNKTTATEGGDYPYTLAGDVLTVGVAAAVVVSNALGAVHDVDTWSIRGPWQIGDDTRGVELRAGAEFRAVDDGLFLNETVYLHGLGVLGPTGSGHLQCFGDQPAFAADDDHWLVGLQRPGYEVLLGCGYEGGEITSPCRRYNGAYLHHVCDVPMEWVIMANALTPGSTTPDAIAWQGGGSLRTAISSAVIYEDYDRHTVALACRPGTVLHRLRVTL